MIEVRDSGEFWTATGHATTWSHRSRPYFISSPKEGMFLEQIDQGAFADAVEGRESVELRLEHRTDGPVLAATGTNTLHYRDQDDGLMQVALLRKADPEAALAVRKIESNSYSGLSVGMIVHDDHWGKASDGATRLRTITRAGLVEVSIVHRPANPGAQVMSVRQENRSATGDLIEYRSYPVGEVHRAPVDEKYTAAEVVALGKKGQAMRNSDGGYSFPIADREDLENAIRAVGGRAQKSPPEKVRVFIRHRAAIMGLSSLIPSTWNADGTVKQQRSAPTAAEMESRALIARSEAVEAEFLAYAARQHKTPAQLEVDALLRRSREVEAEALAVLTRGSHTTTGRAR